MSKACKLNDLSVITSMIDSGKRERNTLVIYLQAVNNHWKRWLIHDMDGGTSVIPIERSAA